MKRILLTLCILIVLLTMISVPTYSAESYIWKDKNGVTQITDDPPPKGAKMIDTVRYKRDTPEEIQKYQAEQEANEQMRDAETRQRQQINRGQEEQQRASMGKSRVTLEKRRLEERKEHLRDRPPQRGDKGYDERTRNTSNLIDNRMKEVEKDPEQYFYNKEQREKAAAAAAAAAKNHGDGKSSSDFLPKVGKYRWEVE